MCVLFCCTDVWVKAEWQVPLKSHFSLKDGCRNAGFFPPSVPVLTSMTAANVAILIWTMTRKIYCAITVKNEPIKNTSANIYHCSRRKLHFHYMHAAAHMSWFIAFMFHVASIILTIYFNMNLKQILQNLSQVKCFKSEEWSSFFGRIPSITWNYVVCWTSSLVNLAAGTSKDPECICILGWHNRLGGRCWRWLSSDPPEEATPPKVHER